MSFFRTELVTVRNMTKDYCWVLKEPLVYENDNYIITVMPGFDFDFASIPWFFRRVIPKNGAKYDRASCLHDAMYAAQIFSKSECDDIFLEAMLSDGTNEVLANIMHDAVVVGGDGAYEDVEEITKYKDLISVELKNISIMEVEND